MASDQSAGCCRVADILEGGRVADATDIGSLAGDKGVGEGERDKGEEDGCAEHVDGGWVGEL